MKQLDFDKKWLYQFWHIYRVPLVHTPGMLGNCIEVSNNKFGKKMLHLMP